jgi:hypothetical protein
MRQGLNGVTAVGVYAQNHLAVRETGDEAAELWRGSQPPELLARLAFPLARDNPVIAFQASVGEWLVYPSYSGVRRAAVRATLPGLPLYYQPEGGIGRTEFLPWEPWLAEATYRFLLAPSGLIAAVSHGLGTPPSAFSGLYQRHGNSWQRLAEGEIDVGSATIAPGGQSIAWREQRHVAPNPRQERRTYITRRQILNR